jgi:hypothetical protein
MRKIVPVSSVSRSEKLVSESSLITEFSIQNVNNDETGVEYVLYLCDEGKVTGSRTKSDKNLTPNDKFCFSLDLEITRDPSIRLKTISVRIFILTVAFGIYAD